jgi:hypothetical protein
VSEGGTCETGKKDLKFLLTVVSGSGEWVGTFYSHGTFWSLRAPAGMETHMYIYT